MFCNPNGQGGFSAAPGECYWYQNFDRNKIGIIIHLGTIMPAGLLAFFQFIPFIRYKAILFHRMNGYVILILVAVSDAGAVMVANHAFSGTIDTQIFVGLLVTITTITLVLAMINIKRLQIEQHRAWMLRSWFYFASIITLRIVQSIAVTAQASWPESQPYLAMPCAEVLFTYKNNTTQLYNKYPACDPANSRFSTDGFVVVKGDTKGNDVMQVAAALGANFGMAGFFAWAIHAIGVELYLRLTPRESNRLRQISYERQLERGYKNAGSAGLVIERLGDAEPWVPMTRIEGHAEAHDPSSSNVNAAVKESE